MGSVNNSLKAELLGVCWSECCKILIPIGDIVTTAALSGCIKILPQ